MEPIYAVIPDRIEKPGHPVLAGCCGSHRSELTVLARRDRPSQRCDHQASKMPACSFTAFPKPASPSIQAYLVPLTSAPTLSAGSPQTCRRLYEPVGHDPGTQQWW